MDTLQLIWAGVSLVTVGLLGGGLYLANKLRRKRRNQIFELYRFKFKLEAPSPSLEPKSYNRFVRKRLKIKWAGFKIDALRFLGEPASVSIEEALKLLTFLNQQRSGGEFTPQLDELQGGVFVANFQPDGSEAIERWKDELAIYHGLSQLHYGLDMEKAWPEITFESWEPEGRPRFTSVTVEGLPSKVHADYSILEAEKSFGVIFSHQKRRWKIEQLDSTVLRISSYTKDSDEGKTDGAKATVDGIVKKIVGLNRNELSPIYSRTVVEKVTVENGSVNLVILNFSDDSSGRLHVRENYILLVQSVIKELRSLWPGDWKSQNNLVKNGTILLKRF